MTAYQIEFRWAFDAHDKPIHIDAAQRGAFYHCPLCTTPMVARLGQQVQHHFAHDHETQCTTDGVDRAALRRFLRLFFDGVLAEKRALTLRWTCRYCGAEHGADLLHDVSAVSEAFLVKEGTVVDVALLDAENNPQAVFMILPDGDAHIPLVFPERPAFEFGVPLAALYGDLPAGPDIARLLGSRAPLNAPCPVWENARFVVRDPETVLRLMLESVEKDRTFAVPVERIDGLEGMARLGQNTIWMTAERWRVIVGGTLSRIGGALSITIREWNRPDGALIHFYHVALNETEAIAGRRFLPGEHPAPRIDERFRLRRATALEIAQSLITS